MYSIRRRLMLVLAVGFAALIVATGVYADQRLRRYVTDEFDAALLARARALVSLTDQEDGVIELDYKPELMPEFERKDKPDYFQIWLDDRSPRVRSRHLGDKDLPCRMSLSVEPFIRDVRLPDGRAGRSVEFAFVPRDAKAPVPVVPVDAKIAPAPGERGLILAVARGRGDLDQLLAQIRLAMVGVGGLIIALAVVLVWRALAAGFRPLDKIASQVRALDAENLESRVVLKTTPQELAPIIDQLNGLLQRLESSFQRERRFTGNVAHELRTPIAELRSLADVATRWPEDRDAVAGFFSDVRAIGENMERVIVDLLLLARCQAGVERVERSPTNIEEIVSSAWSRLEAQAVARDLRFRADLGDELIVDSDPGKLSIIFRNLLGNAVSYALPGTEIACTARRGASGIELEVRNEAEPLDAADFEKLAEPFWRRDESRSAPDHAGLGLSVVSAVAGLLRIDVGFRQDADGTFRVRLLGWQERRGAPVGA